MALPTPALEGSRFWHLSPNFLTVTASLHVFLDPLLIIEVLHAPTTYFHLAVVIADLFRTQSAQV